MPEISRFYGIVIRVFYDDHSPPHFHAAYGEHEVRLNINTLAILSGGLPAPALGMVAEWASLRQHELRAAWDLPGTGQASFSRPGGSRLCREIARSHDAAVHRTGARVARSRPLTAAVGPTGTQLQAFEETVVRGMRTDPEPGDLVIVQKPKGTVPRVTRAE